VAGCCECGDEPSGSCATEFVSYVRHKTGTVMTGIARKRDSPEGGSEETRRVTNTDSMDLSPSSETEGLF
jgi:hypothetical protein